MVGLILVMSVMAIGPEHFGLTSMPSPGLKGTGYNDITNLGLVLYTDYVYPFEIAAVLLLTAIVASISLSHQKPKHRKVQKVSAQIAVRREDRVRLINIPSEKKISIITRGRRII
jgi:NADH-quinone oxidoreductase subunit J